VNDAPGPDDAPRITLVGKPDCHLCEEARAVIASVCAGTGDSFVELSILDEPELADLYWEQIPVTLVDGLQHDFWRVDPVRLRAALSLPRPGHQD
jgi:hypothetical protein